MKYNTKYEIEMLKTNSFLISSAPARADFLNTHQDYKGLPVVPIAVNLRTYFFAINEINGKFKIISLNLKRQGVDYIDVFSIPKVNLKPGKWFGNYLRSVFISLQKYVKKKFNKGLEVIIESEVPVASGLASSAALEVAFTKLLSEYYNLNLSLEEIAEISFIAENKIFGIPCGRLDQYGSSFGKAIVLYPKPPIKVETLPISEMDIIVVDSGIRHSVADIHPKRQEEINIGLKQLMKSSIVPKNLKEKLGYRFDEPKWDEIKIEEIEKYLELINNISARRILYTIKTHESTLKAIEIIKSSMIKNKLDELGKIMNEQHEFMRDLYEISLPKIEEIRNEMLNAGALGVKISGAGLGGCLIGIVKEKEEGNKIVESAIKAGAKNGWVLKIDEGVKAEWR
ncbi:MAG: galactokinase family protein [Nitrososphaerota archaeon]